MKKKSTLEFEDSIMGFNSVYKLICWWNNKGAPCKDGTANWFGTTYPMHIQKQMLYVVKQQYYTVVVKWRMTNKTAEWCNANECPALATDHSAAKQAAGNHDKHYTATVNNRKHHASTDTICNSQNNATGGARFALRADDLSGTGYQKQSHAHGRTAELLISAHFCTIMPASNTDFSISQMHYGY